jgi:hypothetical protein
MATDTPIAPKQKMGWPQYIAIGALSLTFAAVIIIVLMATNVIKEKKTQFSTPNITAPTSVSVQKF